MILNEKLKKQLQEHFGHWETIPADLHTFIAKIGETYTWYENNNELFGQPVNDCSISAAMDAGIIASENSDSGISLQEQLVREKEKRRQAEQKLTKANILYSFLSQINQSIVHSADANTLFRRACQIAVGQGLFKTAWIGLFNRQENTIDMVAGQGVPPEDEQLFRRVAFSNGGLQATVLRTGKYFLSNNVAKDISIDTWSAYATERGYLSCMVLPITNAGSIIGTFNLYAAELDAFGLQEIALLTEAAGDISFALGVFEKDTRIRHSQMRLNQAQALAHIGSWELDLDTRIVTWSAEHCAIYGLPAGQNTHSFKYWLSFVHPGDAEYVLSVVKEVEQSSVPRDFGYRIIRTDGAVRYIHCQSYFEFDNTGKPTSICGVSHDVTEKKEGEVKLVNANRLYSFTSKVSQAIAHIYDEQTLFSEVCRIAVEIGEFQIAWIGNINYDTQHLVMAGQCGIDAADVPRFANFRYQDSGPQTHVINTGKPFIANNIRNLPDMSGWRAFALSKGWGSFAVYPIRRQGHIVATLNICASENHFFNIEEVKLLTSATDELSYALNALDQERLKEEADKKLLRSELHLKQAQAIAQLGSWELDFSTGIATWTEEALRIYGLPEDQVEQSFNSWLSFIHPDDKQWLLPKIEEAGKTLSNTSSIFRIVRRDGEVRHVRSLAHYILNDHGTPVGIHGVEYDITDIKNTENALMQSKANLRLIVDLLPQAIFAIDTSGRFVFANSAFARLYALQAADIPGKGVYELITDITRAEMLLQHAHEVIYSSMNTIVPEMQIKDHRGRSMVYHATMAPFTMAGSTEQTMLGVLQDITVQKRAEKERQRIIDDMVQRNKDLEQFSYIVSHNLRSPVANLIGLVNLLTEGNEDDKDLAMQSLPESAMKLDEIIRDLNYILQIKHDVDETRAPVKLSALIADVKLSIANLLKSEHVVINTDFSAADELHTLKSYLHSIVFNLITNSIKYCQPGLAPVINITTTVKQGAIQLHFADNGLGIDMDKNKHKIFGLYKRFHTHAEGKGMGLYMVKTQVEKLGGTIHVESEVNKGTTFSVMFGHS